MIVHNPLHMLGSKPIIYYLSHHTFTVGKTG